MHKLIYNQLLILIIIIATQKKTEDLFFSPFQGVERFNIKCVNCVSIICSFLIVQISCNNPKFFDVIKLEYHKDCTFQYLALPIPEATSATCSVGYILFLFTD